MDTTAEEQRVIEVLVAHEKTSNAYGRPIVAVGMAMMWNEATTLEVVKDLERRNVAVRRMDPLSALSDGEAKPQLKSWWERTSG